jgi:DNA-binding beta-propeller fold protein YncE
MSTAVQLRAIELVVPAGLQDLIAGFGRTEDLDFSPDGRRLAVAGFGRDRIYLLDVLIDDRPDAPATMAVHGVTELAAAGLHNPHGLSFVDDGTLVVANRNGDVVVFALPRPAGGMRVVHTRPAATISAEAHGLASPGSVSVAPVAADLHEMLVCNNAADTVTRHLVDRRRHPHVISGHVALADGLSIPDGVALSADRRWVAVSSHITQAVLLYRNGLELGPHSRPAGVLRGICYPHGLRFTADGRFVVVADAGAPNIHVFASLDGDWSGEHTPTATHRVMDEACFRRGRVNPQEGGPKGLALDRRGRLLAVTSEQQPLALFDLRQVLPGTVRPQDDVRLDEAGTAMAEAARTTVLRELRRVEELRHTIDGQQHQIAEQQVVLDDSVRTAATLIAELNALRSQLEEARAAIAHQRAVAEERDRELRAIRDSTSWRATAAARAVSKRLRRSARRLR